MSRETRIGKIESIRFGLGGYQDACVGISVTLSGRSWGVGDFRGYWAVKRGLGTKWREADRIKYLGETVMWLKDLLEKSKVSDINDLAGKPVEVTFDGNRLASWRLLDEAL